MKSGYFQRQFKKHCKTARKYRHRHKLTEKEDFEYMWALASLVQISNMPQYHIELAHYYRDRADYESALYVLDRIKDRNEDVNNAYTACFLEQMRGGLVMREYKKRYAHTELL